MYSLYRAWLSLGPCPGLPPPPVPLNLTLAAPTEAPDVNLQVGPTMTHFAAHRAVLSAHSGFFKAALANHHHTGPVPPIQVPNVNVDEFSALLAFMYTGYLDLNIGNIYNILLATHMLHMPRALEMCRTFLMQQNQTIGEPAPKINVVKPIAIRKMAPAMQEAFASAIEEPKNDALLLIEETAAPLPATADKKPRSPPPPPPSTTTSTVLTSDSNGKKEKPPSSKQSCSNLNTNNNNNNKKRSDSTSISSTPVAPKVIVDVACCDGPVRFHRVVNKNYGLQLQDTENYRHDTIDLAMNKVMNENIMEKLNGEGGGEVFTCVYCNHKFKSQYCYQKHARRHLYPVSVDKIAAAQAETTNKREVKLLDMNVQYYPCKTCGSKFPSYYFVHKHRKMCHAEEVADKDHKNNEIVVVENSSNVGGGEGGAGRGGGERGEGDSSSCSAIDVEGVANENEDDVT